MQYKYMYILYFFLLQQISCRYLGNGSNDLDENLYLENVTIGNTYYGNITKFIIISDRDEKKNTR